MSEQSKFQLNLARISLEESSRRVISASLSAQKAGDKELEIRLLDLAGELDAVANEIQKRNRDSR